MTTHTTDPNPSTASTASGGDASPHRRDHNLWPGVTCADALAIRRWLAALGFDEGICVLDDDEATVHHSEMLWPEGGRVMVSSAEKSDPTFAVPVGGGSCYVVCDDPDAVLARATALGARVLRPMEETDYGSRGFSIADTEGNRWSFGTYSG
ncbi:VOC family protein [Lapillicoccus sp.]|uniref:VOC family protein n=1 Tax=Lapillicoccus sp. TaxID=1909287 RepID=UPI0025F77FF0|nr:VOC family protein [Lapillicoccus sp.]